MSIVDMYVYILNKIKHSHLNRVIFLKYNNKIDATTLVRIALFLGGDN